MDKFTQGLNQTGIPYAIFDYGEGIKIVGLDVEVSTYAILNDKPIVGIDGPTITAPSPSPSNPFPFPIIPPTYPTNPSIPPPPPPSFPPVGGGGGSGGSFVNPDVINNFVLDKATQDKYPKFIDLIKRLENFVANDKKVMDALIKWSGYNREQILEKVKFGNGPTLVVKEMEGKYGYFDRAENPNVINIAASWVRGLESANLLETREATGFFLGVTVLHEFVHQARAVNGLDRNYEYGYGFEQSAFGLIIEDDGIAPFTYRFRLYKK